MKIYKGFVYELMPTGEQIRVFKKYCGCYRFVYNKALDWKNNSYKTGDTRCYNYFRACENLIKWKEQFPWLKEAINQSLQAALKDLEHAFNHFYLKQRNFPVFKKKSEEDSFRYPYVSRKPIKDNKFFVPKLGWVQYRNSRPLEGKVKNATIFSKCNKWFVAFQTEFEKTIHPATGPAIGIDLGVVNFATTSEGEQIPNQQLYLKSKDRIRILSTQLNHKVIGSNNFKKASLKLAKYSNHIKNKRKDFLHKLSTRLSKNHAIVVMEDLRIASMIKSAHGTKENPGKDVRKTADLNRMIKDQGWRDFRNMMEYKTQWNGGTFILVPSKNTSRTCPSCGFISKDNRVTQNKFICKACGHSDNADIVGAINILRAGHAQLACEVSEAVKSPATGTQRNELASCCS